jgi:hypothetical protein
MRGRSETVAGCNIHLVVFIQLITEDDTGRSQPGMFTHITTFQGRIDIDDLGDQDVMALLSVLIKVDTQGACTDKGSIDGRII